MIHLYCGDGKGKTTAAMGLALRALAAGRGVVVVQVRLLKERFGVAVFAGKAADKFTWSMTDEELAATRALHDENLARALSEVKRAGAGLLVLDEAVGALGAGLLDPALVRRALDAGKEGLEVVLTGRNPSEEVSRMADYTTEMRCVRHPFDRGVPAREGVEY